MYADNTPHCDSRPLKTGQGLTEKQIKFFKTPRTMKQVTEFFGGDPWESNKFQNKFIGNDVLKINEDCTIELVIYDKKP